MIKIDIVSGFLGAGKTTLIKKLLKEALDSQKVVLIENEFGEIGIDGGFLKEAGIEIREMNSGCICCSLVGDFGTSLKEVIETYHPERILIEPSGVGKLSDVMKAVNDVEAETGSTLNSAVAVVDAKKCKMFIKNFGEFFVNQIEHAGTIILSRTDAMSEDKIKACVDLIREHNKEAVIITTPWDKLEGTQILEAIEKTNDLEKELMEEAKHHHHEHGHECGCGRHHHEEHGHECGCGHHHHEEHGHECGCGHHHHEEHSHECGCGHHHHEEHGHECGCGHHHHEEHEHECGCGHHHHEEHGHECGCGCGGHHHDHHGHHHADEVFGSWGFETPATYSEAELKAILEKLDNEEMYGFVLRSKGMIQDKDNAENWLYFDYVPGEYEIRSGKPDYTGKICVIGSKLKEDALKELFNR